MPSLDGRPARPRPGRPSRGRHRAGTAGRPLGGPSLYAALGDADVFAAWSIRHAIRTLGAWDQAALTSALADPARREDALKLADESWAVPAIQALASSLASSSDPAWKARVVAALAGQYRRYPEWSGHWFGTNPLAGAMPRKTRDWLPEGMDAVLVGLSRALEGGRPVRPPPGTPRAGGSRHPATPCSG